MAPISETEFIVLGGWTRAGANNFGQIFHVDVEECKLTTIVNNAEDHFDFSHDNNLVAVVGKGKVACLVSDIPRVRNQEGKTTLYFITYTKGDPYIQVIEKFN